MDLVLVLDASEATFLDKFGQGNPDELQMPIRVLPAFLFKFMKERRNREGWELAAQAGINVVSLLVPAGAIYRGVRIGGTLGRALIISGSVELLLNTGSIIKNTDAFQAWLLQQVDGDLEAYRSIMTKLAIVEMIGNVATAATGAGLIKLEQAAEAAATLERLESFAKAANRTDIPGIGDLARLRNRATMIKNEMRRLGHWADYERAVGALDATLAIYKLGRSYPNLMRRLIAIEDLAIRSQFLDDFPLTETRKLAAFEADPSLVNGWETLNQGGNGNYISQVFDDIENNRWITGQDVEIIGRTKGITYTTKDGVQLKGETEFILQNDGTFGLRIVAEYPGFGGKVILDPNKTTTVMGRMVDPDGPSGNTIGTLHFSKMDVSRVGKNRGGIDVLSVSNEIYSWSLNNAWLRACLSRVKNGTGSIQFVHDPTKRSTFFRNDGSVTVTGYEMQVLLSQGYAPDPNSGIVKNLAQLNLTSETKALWDELRQSTNPNFALDNIDRDYLDLFTNGSQVPFHQIN